MSELACYVAETSPLPLGYSETRYAHSAPYGSGPTFIATDLVVDAGDNVQTHICG